jgi:dTDP-L-rhamnose 4-epimerase
MNDTITLGGDKAKMNVLVTGGAGFIGTSLTRRLLREGCSVAVFDNFNPQVHAGTRELPPDIASHVQLHRGDVRDGDALSRALTKREVVVHLAAETGTGQSMYEMLRYQDTNIGGAAILADYCVNKKSSTIQKIVVASTRAVYGEGKYHCRQHGAVFPRGRKLQDMKAKRFEPLCSTCGSACDAVPTPEDSPLQPTSFYGLTKQVQEQMLSLFAETIGLEYWALRFQNVYGPGQSLNNPYTGILAVFSNQAQANGPIEIFEDGLESRDFVYIDDAVEAIWRCIAGSGSGVEVLNVGTGVRVTVSEVVCEIVRFFESQSRVAITGAFRQGDIRHNCADLAKIQRVLNFTPKWKFAEGLREFLNWASAQNTPDSQYDFSLKAIRERGLLHG